MRERGGQARRARGVDGDPGPTPPPTTGLRFWQALAIIGLIAATAGWTTVAVIAMRPAPTPAAVAETAPSDEPLPSDEPSTEPAVASHEVVDLEHLLPAAVNGTSLTHESWTGATILGDDPWSTSITAFITKTGKTAADLQAAQAYDPAAALDLAAGAFRVSGIDGTALRDAIIAAYKSGDYPNLKVTDTKIGGLDVARGDFGDGGIPTYWYVRDGVVFDIESGDATIVAATLMALPAPGASPPSSAAPASASPAASPSPS